MRSKAREWGIRLLLVATSIALAIAVAEITLRVFFPISDGRENVDLDGKPIAEWFEPGSIYRQLSNEYDAITTISPTGHRVPADSTNPEVIFLGDSFTYGWGLSDDDTFANIYCNALPASCANLGVPGTGTAKQLERLRHYLITYNWRPREVKLFFFGMSTSWSAGNDFVDNFDERGRAKPTPDSDLAEEVESRTQKAGLSERLIGLQGFLLSHSYLVRYAKYYWGPVLKSLLIADPGEERMEEALRYTEITLRHLDEMSRELGFNYNIYLIVPVHDVMRGSYPLTEAALSSVAPKSIISTAHLFTESPRDFYFAYDGHINAEGSRRIGVFLLKLEEST